jgi:hypothetical protein
VTLTDLSLAHAPQYSPDERDVASYALEADDADITLRNLRLAHSAGYGIRCVAGAVLIENVSISGTAFNALTLDDPKPGVHVTNVTIQDTENKPLHLDNVVGIFKDVTFSMGERDEIQIWGSATAIKFENLPAEHFAKIRWLEGATANDPKPIAPDSLTESYRRDRTERRVILNENLPEKNERDARRSAAVRDFEKTLKTASTPAAHKDAVIQHLRTLLDIGDIDFNSQSGVLILGELSAYNDRFGPLALEKLLRELPTPNAEFGVTSDYLSYLPAFLKIPIAEAGARKSLASSFDLPAVLATWKSGDGKDPRAAANAFAEMVKTVSQKADASTDEEKKILKSAVLAEISPFIEARGYAALSALIDVLASKPVALLAADDVRAAMSPEQKRALAKHLISE